MRQPLQVFIADDHPIFRCGLCEVIGSDERLQLAGEAADGQEALRQIRETRPDVVILDVHMPRMSGLEVARELADEALSAGIVLLTMHEDEELLNEALRLGVGAYVLKENAVQDLLSAVHAVAQGETFISPQLTRLVLRRRGKQDQLLREKPGIESLTPAEQRILRMISEDRTTKEIASTLGCAVRTVETHRQNISTKLGLRGSHSLLKFAYDNKSRLPFVP